MTDLLQRALAAIPERKPYDTALATIGERLTDLRRPWDKAADRRRIVEDATEQLLAGEPVPDELGARLVGLEAATERQTEARVLAQIREGLVAARDSVTREHARPGFEVLAGELEPLLADVRTTDRTLGGITSPERAVSSGAKKAAAWAELMDLVERYGRLRQAQDSLVKVCHTDGRTSRAGLLEDAGCVKNLMELDPVWQMRLSGVERETVPPPPWPAPLHTTGNAWWPTTDQAAYLRWLATGPAEPWIPNYRQMVDHHQAMHEAVQDAQAGLHTRNPKKERAARRARERALHNRAPASPANAGAGSIDSWNA